MEKENPYVENRILDQMYVSGMEPDIDLLLKRLNKELELKRERRKKKEFKK